MKKLISIFGIILLFSCGNSETIEINKAEYNKLKGIISDYPKPFVLYDGDLEIFENGIILGSDSHEYLVTGNGTNSKSTEHYIDCKFCTKRKLKDGK